MRIIWSLKDHTEGTELEDLVSSTYNSVLAEVKIKNMKIKYK